jgi:hypothetical protein
MEKVLEGYTSKTWSKRYKGEVGAGRLPPKGLAKLIKSIFEAIAKRDIIVDRWKLDVTL